MACLEWAPHPSQWSSAIHFTAPSVAFGKHWEMRVRLAAEALSAADVELIGRFPGRADLSEPLTDFEETAAVIANLDMVITVDTSTGHLTGAIGKPAWIMLSKASDWRWVIDRSDLPRYPSVRLFRQPRCGE